MMTDDEWQHLYENFETTELLSAVDAVDSLRDVVPLLYLGVASEKDRTLRIGAGLLANEGLREAFMRRRQCLEPTCAGEFSKTVLASNRAIRRVQRSQGQAVLTSLSKSGCLSSSFTKASGGLVLPFS